MSKHTPEPWALFEVGDGRPHLCPASESDKMSILTIAEEDGATFACVYRDDDARRIVTCVNACAGMADPAAEIAELKRQRDELLVAISAIVEEVPHRHGSRGNAPGHGHDIPGIWDSDNGELAGKECGWCQVWRLAEKYNKAKGSAS